MGRFCLQPEDCKDDNFLQETMEFLIELKKSESDVRWVGNHEKWMSWQEFKKIANFYYDKGFGTQEISSNLIIAGDDWWLERHEYDGSEWWEYKEQPQKPEIHGLNAADLVDKYYFDS